MIKVTKVEPPRYKYGIKCPYEMTPKYITIHNTANNASAMSEISYMLNNNYEVSYHFAVDDYRVVQGIPLNRNAWHAGDGNGAGNRKSIGIEICYSLGGGEKYLKAEALAVKFTALLLFKYGWGVDRVRYHQDWSGKYCPHRLFDLGHRDTFKQRVQAELNLLKAQKTDKGSRPKAPTRASDNKELHRVQVGAFKEKKNAKKLEQKLKKDGFDTFIVENKGLYKVQLGAFSNPKNAVVLEEKLNKLGYATYITKKVGDSKSPNGMGKIPNVSLTTAQVQLSLKHLGYYYTGNIDGIIGVKHEKAVRDFQRDNGLTVDGIVGHNTNKALVKKNFELQQKLNHHGLKISEDGIIGLNTIDAIKRFQKTKGLTIDGIVGENTLNKL